MTPGEEHFAFYHELGLAITQWAHVEYQLFTVTNTCISNPGNADGPILFCGYFSIENFRSKLAFTNKMVHAKFGGTALVDDWDVLFDRVSRGATKRNYLVHRQVMGYIDAKPGRRYLLIEWPTEIERYSPEETKRLAGTRMKPPAGALGVRSLNAIRFEFFALNGALQNFAARLRGQKEPFPKDVEQVKNPLALQTLNDQMHEVLGHPPKPSRRKLLRAGIDPRDKTPRA